MLHGRDFVTYVPIVDWHVPIGITKNNQEASD